MLKKLIRMFLIAPTAGVFVGGILVLLKSSSILTALGIGIAVGVSLARVNISSEGGGIPRHRSRGLLRWFLLRSLWNKNDAPITPTQIE